MWGCCDSLISLQWFVCVHSRPEPARRTSEQDDRMLVRAALTNRTIVLTDITNSTALTISPRTVQRRLKENGIQKCIAVVKPFLTPEHIQYGACERNHAQNYSFKVDF